MFINIPASDYLRLAETNLWYDRYEQSGTLKALVYNVVDSYYNEVYVLSIARNDVSYLAASYEIKAWYILWTDSISILSHNCCVISRLHYNWPAKVCFMGYICIQCFPF